MAKIYRTDGLYLTHIRSLGSVNHRNNYIFICIFFVEQYMCFEWEPINDPVIVNSGFISSMVQWRKEIFEAIRTGEIDESEANHKFAKYIEKPNGCIEARFRDYDDSIAYKDIILIPKIFGGASLIVEAYTMQYDFNIPENTGYKARRIVNMESVKFYKY